jgi:DNA-binding NtrC family response regulator
MIDPRPQVLIVDKPSDEVLSVRAFLETRGYTTLWAKDGEEAYNILESEPVDVLIAELRAHRIEGLRLLELARRRNPEVCAVLIAEHPELGVATEAMRRGAYDVQTKPLNLDKLAAVLERGISHQRLVLLAGDLQERLEERYGLQSLIGVSPGMLRVGSAVRQVAPTNSTVLIHGETGTGKELVAQALHQNSQRKSGPFVRLNCAALAAGLIESELFGHVRGAFTGAVGDRAGRFEAAAGGTLLLDEVSEIPVAVQAKLLHVLETGSFERVGSSRPLHADVRLVAATNRRLEPLIGTGEFRADLYYRLNVVTLELPPLRERKGDLPHLLEHFLRAANQRHGKQVRGLTRGALHILSRHSWPGNVRELKNLIEGIVVMKVGGGPIDVADLPEHLRHPAAETGDIHLQVGMTLSEIEKIAIDETLKATGYDKKRAAELLGMGLRTLYRKCKELGSD